MGALDKLRRKLRPGLCDRVRADRLTYLSIEKLEDLERLAADVLAEQVPGMFVEAGVALGGASIVVATRAREQGRQFRGYDVFGQIPAPGERDDEKSHARYEVIASGASGGLGGDDEYYGYRDDLLAVVTATFARYDLQVDGTNVLLIEGLFEDTMSFKPDEQLAFVHVDCDWYEPVRYVLETTYPALASGAVVIADDYHDYGGCRDACDEFVEAREDIKVVSTKGHLVMRRA